jgi:hypothetical protein
MFCRLPLGAVMRIPRTHGQMWGSPWRAWPQRIERYINLHDKNCPNVSVILYRETNGINQVHIHDIVDVSRNHC